MPRKQKITEEQVNRYLSQGLSQQEIASMFQMQPATLSTRIKRMREDGTLKVEKERFLPAGISKMDTVVRCSDRKWFRVVEGREGQAVLKGIVSDQYGHTDRTGITVSIEELNEKFEKKQYPQVKCYVDPNLKKKVKDEPVSKETNSTEEKDMVIVDKGTATEVRETLRKGKLIEIPKDEKVTAHPIVRPYLKQVDKILTTVDIGKASLNTMQRTKNLVSQILEDGIDEERNQARKEECP